jgi:hypothetical protein
MTKHTTDDLIARFDAAAKRRKERAAKEEAEAKAARARWDAECIAQHGCTIEVQLGTHNVDAEEEPMHIEGLGWVR